MTKTIVKDEVLFTHKVNLERCDDLNLCRQSYSDGTCFYTLQDSRGNWKIEYGSRDILELIEQLEHEIKIERQHLQRGYNKTNPDIQKIFKELIERKEKYD
jgi:hypothetical protein